MFKTIFALSLVAFASAECPNACSGHGSCGSFDMCTCYRNWQAADCSQRTCPFDRAHVDTPKGDLNNDLAISGRAATIVGSTVYPYGTVESSWSEAQVATTGALRNSGHNYMECSNKGLCDRTTGECDCFDGYDGAACQRASCANDCSGHGTCQSIKQIAAATFDNVYALWDKKATMGCVCDASYTTADCSQRQCKYGVDPLYIDDTYARSTKVTISVGTGTIAGKMAIKFYDVFGEDYTTKFFSAVPATMDADGGIALCTLVESALIALPNKAVPAVDCYPGANPTASAWSLTLDFTSNPGYLKMPEVVTSIGGVTQLTVGAALVSTVEIGEFTDYFATSCATHGLVKFTAAAAAATSANLQILGTDAAALSATQLSGLKKCLGDSNGAASNNVAIENWDLPAPGTYIHVAKAVQTAVTASSFRRIDNILITSTDATATTAGATLLAVNTPVDITQTVQLYTTDGTALKVVTGALTGVADSKTIGTANDVSCETTSNAANCIQVGSKLFIVNLINVALKGQGQLYTVVKIAAKTITLDYSLTTQAGGADTAIAVYQFAPATTGNYVYVSQCSNRGSCDAESGLCTCFKGYTEDDCSTQSSLAM